MSNHHPCSNTAALSNKLRRLELVVILLLSVNACLLFSAFRGPLNDIVRARGFAVVDADGKECARLANTEEGTMLQLLDRKGSTRLTVSFDTRTQEPAIGIIAADGRPLCGMMELDGEGAITVLGSGGLVGLTAQKGIPCVTLTGLDDKGRANFSLRPEGPWIEMTNKAGDKVLAMGVNDNTKGTAILMKDDSGALRTGFQVMPQHSALYLCDARGKQRVSLMHTLASDRGSVEVRNADGSPVFQAP